MRIAIFSCLFFVACSSEVKVEQMESYFDFPEFLRGEITLLQQNKAALVKILRTDNRRDSIIEQNPDWQKEFQLLMNLNINKPANIGKYEITQTSCAEFNCTTYQAKDSSLLIRRLLITEGNNGVEAVEVFKDDHAMFLDNSILLYYYRGKGFNIIGRRNLLGFRSDYQIEASFLID